MSSWVSWFLGQGYLLYTCRYIVSQTDWIQEALGPGLEGFDIDTVVHVIPLYIYALTLCSKGAQMCQNFFLPSFLPLPSVSFSLPFREDQEGKGPWHIFLQLKDCRNSYLVHIH